MFGCKELQLGTVANFGQIYRYFSNYLVSNTEFGTI
jgi:hypothetical protein